MEDHLKEDATKVEEILGEIIQVRSGGLPEGGGPPDGGGSSDDGKPPNNGRPLGRWTTS